MTTIDGFVPHSNSIKSPESTEAGVTWQQLRFH
jgi:hypothetical protein